MGVKLETALTNLEKAAAIVSIVVPAVRKVASIMGVNLTETKQFLPNTQSTWPCGHVLSVFEANFVWERDL